MQATNSMQSATLNLLDECHNIVLEHLRPHFVKMFDSSDLAFIEFADKAQSNDSQLGFFEAMTIIQEHRGRVEDLFYRELGRSFADFGQLHHQDGQGDDTGESSLTLLSKEDTDIQVAIQNMVSGSSMGSAQELVALRQRLAVLNNGQQVETEDIPGGPACIANAFHQSVIDLALEHQTRLIIYMLFNKFVLGRTGALYEDYNKYLVKAGVLPNLKYEVRVNKNKPRAKPQASGENTTEQNGDQSLGDELFDNIMQLLSGRNGQGQTSAGGQPQAPITNPIPQADLVSALHQLQQVEYTQNPVICGNTGTISNVRENDQLIASLVDNLTAERDRLFDGIDRRRLPAADTQVIDLVGMMFEFMLKDDEIPSVAKAELSRLHTPYLKVAIIDKGLFTDTCHPAHELLNTLAKAAARWVVESNLERGIFPAIHDIVERIITDFDNNIELFTELLTAFNFMVRDLENKSAAIEKRTRQAAEGKEKLRLARTHAATMISKCIQGHVIPPAIRKLLTDVWQEKLMFIYLREPGADKSDSWQLAIQAIEAIIWSVEPRTSPEALADLCENLPEMQKQIALACDTLAVYGSSDNESQLALIREHQEAILRKQDDAPRKTEQADKSDPVDPRPSATDQQLAGNAESRPEPVAEQSPNDENSSESAEDQLPPETAAALSELEKVAFGTWFSIQEDAETLPMRVKLSWYSQMSGNYMFVDGMGMRAGVRKQTELASLMATGKAWIIQSEERPLIHRAMEAIRRMLGGEERVPA